MKFAAEKEEEEEEEEAQTFHLQVRVLPRKVETSPTPPHEQLVNWNCSLLSHLYGHLVALFLLLWLFLALVVLVVAVAHLVAFLLVRGDRVALLLILGLVLGHVLHFALLIIVRLALLFVFRSVCRLTFFLVFRLMFGLVDIFADLVVISGTFLFVFSVKYLKKKHVLVHILHQLLNYNKNSHRLVDSLVDCSAFLFVAVLMAEREEKKPKKKVLSVAINSL